MEFLDLAPFTVSVPDRARPGARKLVNLDRHPLLDQEGFVLHRELVENLDRAMGRLTATERTVLVLRFGLEDDEVFSLRQTGDRVGVTPERARQFEMRALRKMRAAAGAELLRDFAQGWPGWPVSGASKPDPPPPVERPRTIPSAPCLVLEYEDLIRSITTNTCAICSGPTVLEYEGCPVIVATHLHHQAWRTAWPSLAFRFRLCSLGIEGHKQTRTASPVVWSDRRWRYPHDIGL